jgi:hypothetical protein
MMCCPVKAITDLTRVCSNGGIMITRRKAKKLEGNPAPVSAISFTANLT